MYILGMRQYICDKKCWRNVTVCCGRINFHNFSFKINKLKIFMDLFQVMEKDAQSGRDSKYKYWQVGLLSWCLYCDQCISNHQLDLLFDCYIYMNRMKVRICVFLVSVCQKTSSLWGKCFSYIIGTGQSSLNYCIRRKKTSYQVNLPYT